ncbi:MAG: mycofactocin biosynthesis FMN-dependent deaminase MftD [Acidobacteria bacterium]|nr:mycofactocin biosynthesis FMN-dependent deaminase MftD [Acidobacteriota bacterium]
MANAWFETVAVAQRRAEKRLPGSVYGAIIGGAEKGVTLNDNLTAFDELGLAPHVAGLHPERGMEVEVMGQHLSMPVIISPTGVQAVHPEGEVAVARAAANRGIAMGLSSFGSKSIEEVCAVNNQVFHQMYWSGGREVMVQRLQRAEAAGAKGIILTLDWSFSNGRDWGSPWIPEKLDLKTMIKLSPQALSRPRWLMTYLKTFSLPDLSAPNMAAPGQKPPAFFGAYYEWMQSTPPSWEDIAWLRSQWNGAFMVKGVCRVDDAKRVRDLGATALSVSNHGGNNLDGTPAPIRVLPSIVAAVGEDMDVVLDGGIRRGSDVVKAVALGAKAVMIGRAYLWGLSVNGQAGVENVLDVLRGGIDSCLLGLGKSHVNELTPDDVSAPDGFFRTLGA